jgi:hypothetical protein
MDDICGGRGRDTAVATAGRHAGPAAAGVTIGGTQTARRQG